MNTILREKEAWSGTGLVSRESIPQVAEPAVCSSPKQRLLEEASNTDPKTCHVSGLTEIEVEDLLDWLKSQGVEPSRVLNLSGDAFLVEWPKK